MTTALKITSYVTLICIYLYLNRRRYRKFWLQYKKFSLKKFLGLVTYVYKPINYHWFYRKDVNKRTVWLPFSRVDSNGLEEAFNSPDLSENTVVPTDGGRYDVHISSRRREPIYWNAEPNEVRRCSWFYKRFKDETFVPYQEITAVVLEDAFRTSFETRRWNRKIILPNGDVVVFQRADVLVLLPPTPSSTDVWANTPQTQPKSSVIKRGMDEFDITEGEPILLADHLLLIVHGIGSFCDLKFRTVEEVVDGFRAIALQLIKSHYCSPYSSRSINRIEMLPINWHAKLHSEDTGIDKKLKDITLPSVPIIRDFINDTLSDILFYRSPKYCQIILTAVGTELNRIHELFKKRNPSFHGNVFLAGHSLGSLILFDLLCYQQTSETEETIFEEVEKNYVLDETHISEKRIKCRISSMILEAGIKQPTLEYPNLNFRPMALFAIGSPISMFVTTIGLDELGNDFALPTCPGFFNIFHPYDPVANRIETLINPQLVDLEPVLIPHHKGGKRMHLQLKETMSRVKAELRDKWKKSVNTFIRMGLLGWQRNVAASNVEAENNAVENQSVEGEHTEQSLKTDVSFGILNKGRRIDYVLQEAPIESFNEYIFALTMSSHLCYWESEDTILLILKEIYSSMGVDPDDQDQPSPAVSPKSSEISTISMSPNTYLYIEPSLTLDLIKTVQQ